MIKRAVSIETNLIPYEYQNRKDIGIFLVFISGDKQTQGKKVQLITHYCELIKDIKADQKGGKMKKTDLIKEAIKKGKI